MVKDDEDSGRVDSDPLMCPDRSFSTGALELGTADLRFGSKLGERDSSILFLGDLSVVEYFGSTFSLRLGVTGRTGDRRLGEPCLGGGLPFKGDVLRLVDPEPWLV